MKKVLILSIAFILFSAFNVLNAQSAADVKDTDTYSVKVFFHCANGKALLESKLPEKRGVVNVVANLETKIVDVTYNTTLTKPEVIVEYIHQIGYLTVDSPKGTKIDKECDGDHGHDHE